MAQLFNIELMLNLKFCLYRPKPQVATICAGPFIWGERKKNYTFILLHVCTWSENRIDTIVALFYLRGNLFLAPPRTDIK